MADPVIPTIDDVIPKKAIDDINRIDAQAIIHNLPEAYVGSPIEENIETSTSEVRLNKSSWDSIHQQAIKNYDFFNDNKRRWLNQVLMQKFTQNIDLVPRFDLPITNYLVIMQSTIYDRMTTIFLQNAKESDKLEDLSLPNFRLALQDFQYALFAQGIGFIYVINKSGKILLKNIKNHHIVYNFDFSRVCVRAKSVTYTGSTDEQVYIYDYYEQLADGTYSYYTFEAKDYFSFDFEKGSKIDDDLKETLKFRYLGNFKVLPIVYASRYMDNVSKLSPITQADEILNILLAFGLAGVPMSVFVKIYVKNSLFGQGNDKLEGFSDLYDILQLKTEEEAGKVDTGDLTALKNFFSIFEAILGWLAQFVGLNQSVVSSKMNEVRKSGASKFADSRSGQIFRDHMLVKLDFFEEQLFESINSIRKGKPPYKFRLIDKNTSILSDPNDLSDYFEKTVRNKFEPYLDALAKLHKITKSDAKILADEIRVQNKEYFPEGAIEDKEPNMQNGLKKATLKGDNMENDNEDDGVTA